MPLPLRFSQTRALGARPDRAADPTRHCGRGHRI